MSEKIAYTPSEFAALFSREKTWTYRQLYDGKIDAITTFGRTMIPASQISKIEDQTARYCKKGKPENVEAKEQEVSPQEPTSTVGNSKWLSWIEKRRGRAKLTKHAGSCAKKSV